AFDQWVSETVKELSTPAREGDLTFNGATVQEVDPAPGLGIGADELRDRVRDPLGGGGSVTITLTAVPVAPKMNIQAVKDALADARYALSGPVRLRRGKRTLEFTPQQIGQGVEAQRAPRG